MSSDKLSGIEITFRGSLCLFSHREDGMDKRYTTVKSKARSGSEKTQGQSK